MQMGVPVYYLTGNHDELLRKLSGLRLSNLHLQNKLVLELDGKQAWFFHGDIFDVTVQHSKWIARLGGWGYDALIGINRVVNLGLVRMGRERISISKRVKDGVKQAVKFIRDFEQIAADLAIENGFDYVVCGHIHQPQIRRVYSENGSVVYLNSGDWVENLTALEYHEGTWRLYDHLSVWVAKEVTKEKTVLQGNPAVDFH
jgi:UDP-2,3-diacylglucosamine pyrophosphatase LpxH